MPRKKKDQLHAGATANEHSTQATEPAVQPIEAPIADDSATSVASSDATTVAASESGLSASPVALASLGASGATDQASGQDSGQTQTRTWARSFRTTLTLPAKGVVLGVRSGNDWVIGFPEDPGPDVKQKLSDAGFSYRARDRKWTTYTHAPTRPPVEALAKSLQAQFRDEISIADYATHQVVIAFDAKPTDEVTAALKEAGFHYRPDQTWNADFTPAAQDFARNLAQSLPDRPRSMAV